MARIVVSAGEQSGFVEWRCHDALHLPLQREVDGPFDRSTGQSASGGSAPAAPPFADGLVHLERRARWTDEQETSARTNAVVGERFLDDLGADPANVA